MYGSGPEPHNWAPSLGDWLHWLGPAQVSADHMAALLVRLALQPCQRAQGALAHCTQMRRSTVVGANGSSVRDGIRTSYGTFLRRHE